MKVLVAVKPGLSGEISPFEMSALEMALRIPQAEVSLLCMAPESAKETLKMLTRLGASHAYLLSDQRFAGSDTLATSYILSKAVKKFSPDLIICGRKTMEGDTAQVPPMLAEQCALPFYSGVYELRLNGEKPEAILEDSHTCLEIPAVISAEKSLVLRRPRLGSKLGTVSVLSGDDLQVDPSRVGLSGSPTRVIASRENDAGRRHCVYPDPSGFREILHQCLTDSGNSADRLSMPQNSNDLTDCSAFSPSLSGVFCLGPETVPYAQTISRDYTVLSSDISLDGLISRIKQDQPSAILFPSSPEGKELSARLASMTNLGLCADCTALETDGSRLIMIRPALAGSVIARIISSTRPALCTVRTQAPDQKDLYLCAGYGAKNDLAALTDLVQGLGGELAATRRLVDNGLAPYHQQVGLTGKRVAPSVYIAVGVSGAVHHLAGMDRSAHVIAVNPDPFAPIFSYADYGFVMDASTWLQKIKQTLA